VGRKAPRHRCGGAVTKKTPLEEFHDARLKALEKATGEVEETHRAETDPALTPNQRLTIFKGLQAWPRIVLGLYRAERAAAKVERKRLGVPKYGRETPAEIARMVVGEAIGLGPDRVRDLCKEGTRHLNEGFPPRPEIRAAEFIEYLRRARG